MAAVIQAEAIAARATADFIKEVGFTKETDAADPDFGSIKNISFTYNRVNADGTSQMASITVPLLTIVPIPTLRVAEAEIELDIALTQPDQNSSGGGQSSSTKAFALDKPLRLKGLFAKKPSGTSPATGNSITGNMNVKIKLAQAEPTIGMVQLISILDNAKKE
ncbi:uncharacterized protein DUF2589 [Algoriphagus boseongensis]|uniref:Uncharacterized protein DUF2589 n=2 Tax=Algoriphagus boseongensis TaxID=1442587 RepID=A0A4R6T8C4_9BACT|nr:uncharacterized protein DUF2589 [Algoriphagus boseongensis]